LARPDSRVLGLVGAGVQAVTQAHALSRLFPLSRILAHDICPVTLASLPRRLAFLDIPVEPALPWRIEAEADILCTATSVAVGAGPVIAGADLKPHLHINAVGSDYPGKCELPRFLLESALVVPDLADQARREGECQVLEEERIGPELHRIVKQADGLTGWRDRLTVFDSTGIPFEDALALDLITDLARRAGIGRDIAFADLEAGAPKDPYWGTTATAVPEERRAVR
ncbi:MAG: ornithine cyclodeaminase family protein, partial [Telmatospirillum sp.]|nr:ornithine cyclodeaminase family protein [Telmatospirillum sp.]